ncbi:hypothetical protein BGY98DRAFT_950693 [Russula aff. rugulosa BPL654]|nr:hypothetical protein BGY98DRAFT_950693 [Russula aff. rugulosa BPL654]
MNTQRLLGHCRALSIGRAGHTAVDKTSIHDDNNTDKPASASETMGFRDPLIPLFACREENEVRAKTAPPPPKVVTGKRRTPVGELVAYFDKS